jgi:hypothetical protein
MDRVGYRVAAWAAASMLCGEVAIAQPAPPHGNRTPPRTVGQLAEICAVPASEPEYVATRYFCIGFLYGVGQYHGAAHPVGSARPPLFCVPDPPPKLGEVAAAFVSWARAHPEYAQEGPADGLIRFAAQTYPCPPRQAAPATRRR